MRLTNPSLVVITVCRDNLAELKVTLASIAQQSVSPSRHIVIDGSRLEKRAIVARYADHFGADYVWSPPNGIYEAMRLGLRLCGDDDFVWFVNATDPLATPDSVRAAVIGLEALDDHKARHWLVGKTAVSDWRIPHFLPFPTTSSGWVNSLQQGAIGLPHQSVIVAASALRSVRAFEPPTSFTEDYRIGLSLIEAGYLPEPLDEPLSVYDQSGVSSKYAVRTTLSKSLNRIKHHGFLTIWWEPVRLLNAVRRAVLRRFWWATGSKKIFRALGWTTVDDLSRAITHFCPDGHGKWPQCCTDYLASSEFE